jgi:hypothetical protein
MANGHVSVVEVDPEDQGKIVLNKYRHAAYMATMSAAYRCMRLVPRWESRRAAGGLAVVAAKRLVTVHTSNCSLGTTI